MSFTDPLREHRLKTQVHVEHLSAVNRLLQSVIAEIVSDTRDARSEEELRFLRDKAIGLADKIQGLVQLEIDNAGTEPSWE